MKTGSISVPKGKVAVMIFIDYRYRISKNVNCPVLTSIGDKDLLEAGNKNFKIRRSQSLLFFRPRKTGAVTEYGEKEETISPAVPEILKDWIVNSGLKK